MTHDSLGDRMKGYEDAFRSYIPSHFPTIIRVDGKAFHSLTAKADKPFDADIELLMNETAIKLCEQVQTVQLAYVQSDEISLLLHPYTNVNTQPWFANNLQKMVSVAAATATAAFNHQAKYMDDNSKTGNRFTEKFGDKLPAVFDARVFILPECEVVNYFIWRQQDATRNSISMLARSLYSHKELDKKNSSEMQDLCMAKGYNWNDLPAQHKRGRCVVKQEQPGSVIIKGEEKSFVRKVWTINNDIPIFSKEKSFIEQIFSND